MHEQSVAHGEGNSVVEVVHTAAFHTGLEENHGKEMRRPPSQREIRERKNRGARRWGCAEVELRVEMEMRTDEDEDADDDADEDAREDEDKEKWEKEEER